jgi:hypothetical protein
LDASSSTTCQSALIATLIDLKAHARQSCSAAGNGDPAIYPAALSPLELRLALFHEGAASFAEIL